MSWFRFWFFFYEISIKFHLWRLYLVYSTAHFLFHNKVSHSSHVSTSIVMNFCTGSVGRSCRWRFPCRPRHLDNERMIPKFLAVTYVGKVESPFRKLAPHLLYTLSLPYDDFSRLIPLIISSPQTPFRCAERDFMRTYGVRVTRGPVIPANLTGTLPELHPFLSKKGRGIGARGPSTDSTRFAGR